MTAPNPSEVMAVIARRGCVLRSVGTDGIGKRELVDRVDVSRSTVDRSVRELEANGLIERTGSGYRRTLVGELALEEFDTFASRIDGLVGNVGLLNPLPADGAIDAAMFDDASVVRAERHAPQAPITALCGLISTANGIHALSVAVFPQQVDTYVDALENGLSAEVVLAPEAAERLVSAFDTELSAALDTGRLVLREAPAGSEFGLLVAETDEGPVAGLLLFGEGGVRAFVRNDDHAAVAWARDRLADVWKESSALSADR